MADIISTRNAESQDQIFLGEIAGSSAALLQSGMPKRAHQEARDIYLGEWLEHFEIGPTEAAKIAGCTQGYISNISGGRKANVNALYLLRLSEHIGINVNDFFRPLPNANHLAALQSLSPQGQAALLGRRQQKR